MYELFRSYQPNKTMWTISRCYTFKGFDAVPQKFDNPCPPNRRINWKTNRLYCGPKEPLYWQSNYARWFHYFFLGFLNQEVKSFYLRLIK